MKSENRASKDGDLAIDAKMSETSPAGSTELPPAPTHNESRPTSHQSNSPSDSGSEYSDYKSPATSRPTSQRLQSTHDALEEVSLEEEEEEEEEAVQSQRHSGSDHGESEAPRDHRPASLPGDEEVEEPPQSPADSGSEYSEPTTPNRSRPASMHPQNFSLSLKDQFEDDEPDTSTLQPSTIAESSVESHEEQSTTEVTQADIKSPATLQSVSQQPKWHKRTSSLQPASQQHHWHRRTTSLQPPPLQVLNAAQPQSPEGSNCSDSSPQSPNAPNMPTIPLSPMTPDEARMSMGSMQSIELSESGIDFDDVSEQQVDDVLATPRLSGQRHVRKPSSLEILQNTWRPGLTRQSTFFDNTKDEPLTPTAGDENDEDCNMDSTSAWKSESTSSISTFKRGSVSSDAEVDWHALDKTEEQEKEDKSLPKGVEDESTAFLLARLDQENAKFTADPKSAAGVAINNQSARVRSESRPPSMAQLKRLVSRQDAPSIRYSLAPDVHEQLPDEPPPMTELEFWAALVQDYPSTASRLPTLATTKIRAGIPPPLRGVVWTSMSGARDKNLEEAFEKLQHEESPYEGIINKDVGRSFPGVELFRDAEGEGQKMLGRVLKCFSLHDKDIGYCQGLGFLVGPLLMNMGEKEAFCVLVR